MNFEEKNGILSKRFWDMSEEEVDQAVDSLGIEGWRKKVREDTRNAQDELALGPNPWAWDSWSEKRQKIIQSLAPGLAEEMQKKAVH